MDIFDHANSLHLSLLHLELSTWRTEVAKGVLTQTARVPYNSVITSHSPSSVVPPVITLIG